MAKKTRPVVGWPSIEGLRDDWSRSSVVNCLFLRDDIITSEGQIHCLGVTAFSSVSAQSLSLKPTGAIELEFPEHSTIFLGLKNVATLVTPVLYGIIIPARFVGRPIGLVHCNGSNLVELSPSVVEV